MLGAAAQATERLPLMTFVTCPTFRSTAVVAGGHRRRAVRLHASPSASAPENLNQHITGAAWPCTGVRHERLAEAVEIIRQLFAGQYVKAVREYVQAGFTHVALVQVGAERQHDFIDWSARELLPALREL